MLYLLAEHYNYLADQTRLNRYATAIEKTVTPFTTVVDLGCGSGILGLLALRAGARTVYFVDETAAIDMARHAVDQAGFSDKAQFFNLNSFQLDLPERVDVAICDHVGCFGFDYGILSLLHDARERFLKPGGVLLPERIKLMVAPVESPTCRELVGNWRNDTMPGEYHWVADLSANTKHLCKLDENEMLGSTAELATLELGQSYDPFLSWTAELVCDRDGVLDGLAGCFECSITNGVSMSNSPLADDPIQRAQAYLPLENPVAVNKGDRIKVTIMTRHLDHILAWTVELPESGQRFSATTFNGMLLDRNMLLQGQPDRIASLNDVGRARQVILSYCDGSRTLAEVEALVHAEHPDLLPSAQATTALLRNVFARDTGD